MRDGMVELHDMVGYFAPHLFVVADDIGDIPPSPASPDDAAALAEARAEVERLKLDVAHWRECATSHMSQAFENGGAALDARAQVAALEAQNEAMRAERYPQSPVATWMLLHGYATGHGDTVEDMLAELEAQARRNAALAQSSGENGS